MTRLSAAWCGHIRLQGAGHSRAISFRWRRWSRRRCTSPGISRCSHPNARQSCSSAGTGGRWRRSPLSCGCP